MLTVGMIKYIGNHSPAIAHVTFLHLKKRYCFGIPVYLYGGIQYRYTVWVWVHKGPSESPAEPHPHTSGNHWEPLRLNIQYKWYLGSWSVCFYQQNNSWPFNSIIYWWCIDIDIDIDIVGYRHCTWGEPQNHSLPFGCCSFPDSIDSVVFSPSWVMRVMTRPKPSMAPELRHHSPSNPGDNGVLTKVEVRLLHHSDLMESCQAMFSRGRFVSELVQDLLDGRVSLHAPFLRLTVFESRKNNQPVLTCIDNKRLFALKEYAKKSGQDHMEVNIDFFSHFTIAEVQRFIYNSDATEGRDVRLRIRKTGPKKRRGRTGGKKPMESSFPKQVGAKGSRSDRLLAAWLWLTYVMSTYVIKDVMVCMSHCMSIRAVIVWQATASLDSKHFCLNIFRANGITLKIIDSQELGHGAAKKTWAKCTLSVRHSHSL